MNNKKGFLLLEVMVSVVMITFGLLFVMRGYSNVNRTVEKSRALLRVSLLAQQKMFDLEIKGSVEEGSFSGEFSDAKDIQWKLQARPLAAEGPAMEDLEVVELRVTDETRPQEIEMSVFTYLPKAKQT